jgi:putative membrane protein
MNSLHDRRVCAVLLSLGLAASSGCSKNDASQPAASQGSEATPPEQGSMSTLTDAQIAKILATVDTGEIEQAQLAISKAQQPAVRDFAQQMIDQHTASKQQGAQLVSQAGITAASTPIASNLERKAMTMLDQLKGTDAAGFDAAYMKGQVQQHQEVLNLIDSQLLPAAKNEAMRQQLTAAREMVAGHLKHAQQLEQPSSATATTR